MPLLCFMFLASGCSPTEHRTKEPINDVTIIPAPHKLLYKRGHYELLKSTRVLLNLSDNEAKHLANTLLELIKGRTGYKLKISDQFTTNKIDNSIELNFPTASQLSAEGFELIISRNKITINAGGSNGAIYAMEALVKLLNKKDGKWMAPQLTVEDEPNRTVRAIYLNTPTDNVKELIDKLVYNRINYLVVQDTSDFSALRELVKIIPYSEIDTSEYYMGMHQTPSFFYENMKKNDNLMVLFEADSSVLFNVDSLSILSEAMWSRPEMLNLQKLKEHLTSRTPYNN